MNELTAQAVKLAKPKRGPSIAFAWFSILVSVAAALFLLRPALLPADNLQLQIQRDETFGWECEFDTTIVSAVATVTVRRGTDATPEDLVGNVQVNPADDSRIQWTWTPVNRPNDTLYQVHILASDGSVPVQKFACDGRVLVKDVKL